MILLTLQPAGYDFGRVYCGRVFVVRSVLEGWRVDGITRTRPR